MTRRPAAASQVAARASVSPFTRLWRQAMVCKYTFKGASSLPGTIDPNGNTESATIPDCQQTFTYDTCPANATGYVSDALSGLRLGAGFGAPDHDYA